LRSLPGQVWNPKHFFYHFGFLFVSLEVTFVGLEMQLSGKKTDFGAEGAP